MSISVLLVDDGGAIRQLLGRAMRAVDLEVSELHHVRSPARGPAVLEGHWVDLVVASDLLFSPAGRELVAFVESSPLHANVPIVVVCAGPCGASQLRRDPRVRVLDGPCAPVDLGQAAAALLGLDARVGHAA